MEKYRDPEQYSLTSPKYIEKHFIESLNYLSNSLAICERILKQPVPLSYSRHTSRFLSLYLLALPFNLVTSLGWLTVPIISAVCWSFVSVQEIGHFIEEPFDKETQVIPLNQIVSVVRLDVSEILDGVIESPELDSAEAVMFRETLNNSREKESFFSYYMEPQ
jgi:predicted membrane chloride channel (bestrophin family)